MIGLQVTPTCILELKRRVRIGWCCIPQCLKIRKLNIRINAKYAQRDANTVRWKIFAITVLGISALSGCINQSGLNDNDWTIMIYMAGDNSLSDVVDGNLEEISNAGSSEGLKIVVLSDKAGEGDSHLYYVGKKQLIEQPISSIWLKRPDEVYTGRHETLQSFIDWGMGNYSSSHYMLIMWGHGAGWKGAAEDKGDVLNLTEMRLALGDRKLDIIAFDACYMGTVEIYHTLEQNAGYIIASEKKMPRAGWPYEKILGHVKGHSPLEVGKMIVDRYVEAYEGGKKDSESLSIELALLKTKTGLCSKVKEFLDGTPPVDFSSPMKFEDEDSADLSSVIQDLNVTKELNRTVVKIGRWSNSNSTFEVSNASGLAIYCPKKPMDEAYPETGFATYTGWDRFFR